MARERRKSNKWHGLELAIEGEGLSPKDVNVRQLAELLEATASVMEAIAAERGLEAPILRLVEVHDGSAAYELTSESEDAPDVLRAFYSAAKSRARASSQKVKSAMSRLHNASKQGSLRLVPRDSHGTAKAKAIHLAPPVHEKNIPLESGTEIQGRVIGVIISRGDTARVRFRSDNGRTDEFVAEPDVADAAARLFNKRAVASVSYYIGRGSYDAGAINKINSWDGSDIFDVLHDIEADGIAIDTAAWLRALEEGRAG
jgi:hypothetical protein